MILYIVIGDEFRNHSENQNQSVNAEADQMMKKLLVAEKEDRHQKENATKTKSGVLSKKSSMMTVTLILMVIVVKIITIR